MSAILKVFRGSAERYYVFLCIKLKREVQSRPFHVQVLSPDFQQMQHDWCYQWSRNWLTFGNIWIHPNCRGGVCFASSKLSVNHWLPFLLWPLYSNYPILNPFNYSCDCSVIRRIVVHVNTKISNTTLWFLFHGHCLYGRFLIGIIYCKL